MKNINNLLCGAKETIFFKMTFSNRHVEMKILQKKTLKNLLSLDFEMKMVRVEIFSYMTKGKAGETAFFIFIFFF